MTSNISFASENWRFASFTMDRELNNNSSMEISLYIEKIEAFFLFFVS